MRQGIVENLGKGRGRNARKTPVTTVQKHSDGLPKRCRRQHEIDRVIPVDIPRLDLQPAHRRHEPYRMPPGGRKLSLNPVVSAVGSARSSLHACEIRTKMPVKIRNRKLVSGLNPTSSGVPRRLKRRAARRKPKDQQQ
jgi:hypothetical protein